MCASAPSIRPSARSLRFAHLRDIAVRAAGADVLLELHRVATGLGGRRLVGGDPLRTFHRLDETTLDESLLGHRVLLAVEPEGHIRHGRLRAGDGRQLSGDGGRRRAGHRRDRRRRCSDHVGRDRTAGPLDRCGGCCGCGWRCFGGVSLDGLPAEDALHATVPDGALEVADTCADQGSRGGCRRGSDCADGCGQARGLRA